MYFEKYTVLSTDVDFNLEIKLSTLMRYMQEVATNHANKIHYGRDDLQKNNNIWVVVRTDIKINRLPKVDEEILIYTHPGEAKSFMFPRYLKVTDKHKNILVSVASIWVVVNYDTRKIVLRPFGEQKLPSEVDKDDLPLPEKVSGEAINLVDERKGRYSEVDINGHINNSYYIDYVLDIHDLDFYKKHQVSRVLLNYEREVHSGDLMKIYSDGNNPEIVVGKIDGQLSYLAKVEFKDR